ncbi:MAG: hypothetical protein QGH73_12595 [Rhodospirillales bacterium]|nr:hypothetical protein [Rhodospirillaceae bacterium]MDP6429109.1 hypothetical protein [Rhodospirillales bacterium]MDP6645707.1 hypothetical protein [Rhodospirillales bacterium]MDP6842509.1 hypothetical protein [Rhodospirillales bacterium]|tara:strand:- start:386 stop:1486 length:1101 start_codon:yes stop_codon:yes gene_type:complete
MRIEKWLLTMAALTLPLMAMASGAAAAPFYKGKTLNLIVGYSPGGGSDLMCRLFARHLAGHTPGKPTIVVRNMPGGGGLKAMNYVGEAVKKDGKTALCGAFNTLVQLLKDKALRVDLRKFNFIAGMASNQVFFIRADTKPGIKKPEDIFKAQGVIIGGFRTNSSKDLQVRSAMDLLGIKHKYVTGIRGDGGGRKHIQQGFVNTWQDSMAGYLSISHGTLVKTGIVVPIYQMGELDANGKLSKRNAALPGIPTFFEFYKAKFGKEPSGKVWEVYATMTKVTSTALRALSLPPGSPQAAVADLRLGYGKMLEDDKYWAEAKKVVGKTAKFTKGKRTQQILEGAMDAPSSLTKFLVEYIKKGAEMARKK